MRFSSSEGVKPCFNTTKAEITSPRDAKAYGIETIYQSLALADNVDAAANIFLGREILTRWGTLDDATMESQTRRVMGRAKRSLTEVEEPLPYRDRRAYCYEIHPPPTTTSPS